MIVKNLLSACLLLLASASFAQTWDFVGSSSGMASGITEMDMAVTPNGELYVAYIDPSVSNKVTVKKWSSVMGFQTVGTAGIGDANVFDLQLIITGSGTPVFAAKTYYMSDEFLEIYKLNGTTWVPLAIGSGGYNEIDHNAGYSLSGSSNGKIYLSFYNLHEQSTGYTPENAMITVNITDQVLFSPSSPNLEQTSVYGVELMMDGNNAYVAEVEADMSNWVGFNKSINAGTYISIGMLDNADGASKVSLTKNSGAFVSTARVSESSTVLFKAYNGSVFYNEITLLPANALQELDMISDVYDSYVLYKSTSTVYLKKVTGVNNPSPTASIYSSGASFIPVTATELQLDKHYSSLVVAYIDGGKIYVKETNMNAYIEDYDYNVMCEGTSYTTNFGLYALEDNFNKNNLTVSFSSQNTSVIPNSYISSSQSFINESGVGFYLTISNTNDVSTPTTVDVLFTLKDHGVPVGTQIVPVLVNPKPDIVINSLPTEICKNIGPMSLNTYANPSGGTWSGIGVMSNTLYPATTLFGNANLTYTKTNSYGCTNSATATITVNNPPTIGVTTTSTDCLLNTGTATVNISGGHTPYTIHWSTGANTATITDLASGAYFATVTDDKGCVATSYAMVNSNGVNQTGTVTNATCHNSSNGSVSVTISGGVAPLTFNWSNGATTQNLSNVPAGPYELMIEDAQGCISAHTYTVTSPQQIMLDTAIITMSTCGNNDGDIDLTIAGGTTPFTYVWKDINGSPVGGNVNVLSNVNAGAYSCAITDANGCTFQTLQNLSSVNSSIFAVDDVVNSSCLGDGAINIVTILGQANSYLWSNGSTSQNATNLTPGSYSVQIIDSNNCTTVLGGTVYPELPPALDICMVTVDSVTAKNLVVWEKPITTAIDHFNIYRETSTAGLYQLVKSIDYNDVSEFVDSVASPNIRSWRYKISSVDGCGNESAISTNHKTIHLSSSLGLGGQINLFWDSYEGFSYSQFVLKRYTTAEGWVLLQNMPTNLFTYTDTPPSTAGLFYLVTVEAPSTCSSTLKAQDFNTVRSNRQNSAIMGQPSSVNENNLGFITMYPNPVHGSLQVMNNSIDSYSSKVLDQTGRVIAELTINTGLNTIDCKELANGVYFLEISTPTVKDQKRFVVSK